MLPGFSYTRPETLKKAVEELKAAEDTYLHAGGTDLIGCLHDGVFPAGKVVSISALKDLQYVRKLSDGGLLIGALTTIRALETDADIGARYPVLSQAAAEVASPQLREQGTLGGNLCQKPRCWYYRGEFDCLRKGGKKCFAFNGQNQFHCILGGSACYIVHPSDTAPALLALDASLQVSGPQGERSLPLSELHVAPSDDPRREIHLEAGEIITAIRLPKPAAGLKSSYRKIRARQSWDFAVAGVALALVMDNGTVKDSRVVLSGAAPIPWRSQKAEQALQGKPLNAETAESAAMEAMADAQPLEHNAYKVPMFKGLIKEELLKFIAA